MSTPTESVLKVIACLSLTAAVALGSFVTGESHGVSPIASPSTQPQSSVILLPAVTSSSGCTADAESIQLVHVIASRLAALSPSSCAGLNSLSIFV